MSTESSKVPPPADGAADRREFLAKCGRFAIVTPPAVTLLLSTSLTSDAIAKSGGGKGHDKDPPGHDKNPPGRSKDLLGWLLGKLF